MRLTNNISLLLVLGLMFMFTSCEEEYVLETDDFESQLVINSLFTHQSPWLVDVSHTKHIFDKEGFKDVENPSVEIYSKSGDKLYNLYQNEEGFFTNEEEMPRQGKTYTIKVAAEGFQSVLAQDCTPEAREIEVIKTQFTNDKGEEDTQISFTIGNADEDTYVVWEFYSDEESESLPDGNIRINWLEQLSKNPKTVVFGGKFNVGQTKTGNITTTLNSLRDGGRGVIGPHDEGNSGETGVNGSGSGDISSFTEGDGEDDEEGGGSGSEDGDEDETMYELRVMTISKDLHDYYKSVEEYLKFNPNSSDVQPTEVNSNVTNGYGIFAGYHETIVRF